MASNLVIIRKNCYIHLECESQDITNKFTFTISQLL